MVPWIEPFLAWWCRIGLWRATRRSLSGRTFHHRRLRGHVASVTNGPRRRAVFPRALAAEFGKVVGQYAELGLRGVAPLLRRSFAKLCHVAGGELEQLKLLLGHVSVQTTEVIWAVNSGFAER